MRAKIRPYSIRLRTCSSRARKAFTKPPSPASRPRSPSTLRHPLKRKLSAPAGSGTKQLASTVATQDAMYPLERGADLGAAPPTVEQAAENRARAIDATNQKLADQSKPPAGSAPLPKALKKMLLRQYSWHEHRIGLARSRPRHPGSPFARSRDRSACARCSSAPSRPQRRCGSGQRPRHRPGQA